MYYLSLSLSFFRLKHIYSSIDIERNCIEKKSIVGISFFSLVCSFRSTTRLKQIFFRTFSQIIPPFGMTLRIGYKDLNYTRESLEKQGLKVCFYSRIKFRSRINFCKFVGFLFFGVIHGKKLKKKINSKFLKNSESFKYSLSLYSFTAQNFLDQYHSRIIFTNHPFNRNQAIYL